MKSQWVVLSQLDVITITEGVFSMKRGPAIAKAAFFLAASVSLLTTTTSGSAQGYATVWGIEWRTEEICAISSWIAWPLATICATFRGTDRRGVAISAISSWIA